MPAFFKGAMIKYPAKADDKKPVQLLDSGVGGATVAKLVKKGIVLNVSTYPLPTLLPRTANRRSKTLTFDVNFDLVEDDGKSTKVWFYRGFRFPPPLDDGDRVEVVGRYGRFFRDIFYASRIVDPRRNRIYTGFRNRKMKAEEGGQDKPPSSA